MAVFDLLFIPLYGRIILFVIPILALGVSVQVFRWCYPRSEKIYQGMLKTLPLLAVVAVLIFAGVEGSKAVSESLSTARLPAALENAPNVLVIIIDTLRADHVSAYGYERDTSPFIDQVAAEGVLFENAISTSSWTQPVHASLLTGAYTHQHQAEIEPLDENLPTLGEVLQTNGYRTGAFSANTFFFTRRQGFGRGFLHFEDNYQSLSDLSIHTVYGFLFDYFFLRKVLDYEEGIGRRLAEDINASALKWIGKNPHQPFFVFLNYFDVHDPYTPPQPYRNQYTSVEDPGGLINSYLERYYFPLTPEQLQSEVDAYDGAIAYVDDQIADLFAQLLDQGLLENTLVIISSDHGEEFGEHGLIQHSASLYLQETHVPLIIWWPGTLTPGRITTPVTLASIPATIQDLVSGESNTFPAPSLVKLWSVMEEAEWPLPISELAQFTGASEQNPSTHGKMESIFSTDWHLIWHEAFGVELYDVGADREEVNNLANSDAQETMTLLEQFLDLLPHSK
jgi:arylsulfatase A-like enzyme